MSLLRISFNDNSPLWSFSVLLYCSRLIIMLSGSYSKVLMKEKRLHMIFKPFFLAFLRETAPHDVSAFWNETPEDCYKAKSCWAVIHYLKLWNKYDPVHRTIRTNYYIEFN